ncbi:hypothetical protein CBP16_19655, partial [Fischerella thermalis WC217]
EKYEQFAKIPYNQSFYVSCEVKSKTQTGVIADFFVHDKQGKIYSQLLGGKGIIFPAKLMQPKA